MEILIQPLLERAHWLGSPFHIRYSDRKGETVTQAENGKEAELAEETGKTGKKTSYVIIRKPYSYLEPVVRAMFDEAEDVHIVVDRRSHERRQAVANGVENRRNPASDRRRSAPMLDILINVGI